ncbi:MAG: NADH-quinone oxidoreductase subunit J [Chloroflexota bacterium]
MDFYGIAFYTFAAIILISAAGVIFSRKLMYSAFSLLFTFFGVAGFYVLLNSDFLAITQIMIYIGGILVLIIFGVMLTSRITGVDIKSGLTGKLQIGMAAAAAAIIALSLGVMFSGTTWRTLPSANGVSTIEAIGSSLFTEYLIAVEAAAVMLLIAFLGAALIARRPNN